MTAFSVQRMGATLAPIFVGVALLAATSCGKKPKDGVGGRAVGKVEQAFLDASAATGVPVRFLMAAGYVESRLVSENATSNYVSLDNSTDPVPRGTVMTQTAFGLTYEKIGLDPSKDGSTSLEVQIEAYARWLASSLQTGGISLAPNPVSREEKHYWIENLALLHRSGVDGVRAVQVMFARELIATLNDGFTWQDPRGDETVKLAPENPPIDITAADYPQSGKNWFKIPRKNGIDLTDVPYFRLATLPSGTAVNDPVRIEVVHCPLSLSACLELQTRSQDGDAQLGSYVYLAAHYVIPADVDVYNPEPLDVLQVAPHNQAVTLTNGRGENVKVQDAIVIMLTGNSGRTVAGTRQPAVPTWFSNRQLMAMSDLINQLCTKLSTKDENPINRDDCLKTEGDRGIQFRHQGDSEEYRWGDIADFDATIFNAYVRNAGGLSDEVAFELKNGNREFRAGTQVPLTVLFNSSAREVQIERLRRCQSGKLIWETVSNEQVRAGNRVVVAKPFFDSGPNHSGEQFFRARVYGADTKLTGWAIESVNLTGYDKEPSFASEKNCGQ